MEKNNIFENAKFGNKFITKDNTIVIFYSQKHKGDYYFCIADPKEKRARSDEMLVLQYYPDGKYYWEDSNHDIVSKYQEEIDEEKLDKMSEERMKIKISAQEQLKGNPKANPCILDEISEYYDGKD